MPFLITPLFTLFIFSIKYNLNCFLTLYYQLIKLILELFNNEHIYNIFQDFIIFHLYFKDFSSSLFLFIFSTSKLDFHYHQALFIFFH
jgi:hypothetical protein